MIHLQSLTEYREKERERERERERESKKYKQSYVFMHLQIFPFFHMDYVVKFMEQKI